VKPAVPVWAVLREAGLLLGPAVAGLAVLLLCGGASPFGIGLSVLAGIATATALGFWRQRERGRLAGWLASLAGGAADPTSPVGAGRIEGLPEAALGIGRRLDELGRRLEHRGSRLATILAAIPDPVLLLDRGLDVRFSNPAADQTFGAALEGLPLGRAVRDPGVLAAVDAALTTRTPSTITFSPVFDRMKRFAARVVPVTLDEGDAGVFLLLREESEQVLIERMRSDFVANASHEIRTPLASIIGIVETLRGPARDDAAARPMFLDSLAEEAARMQRLVDDLLSLSRIELAVHRPPDTFLGLDELVRGVLRRMAVAAEGAGVELRQRIERDLPEVRGDADQLEQLVANLVDNAIKYGRGQPVTVALARQAAAPPAAGPVSGRPCLVLSVADQGEGIAPEHLPRLTERFYRVDKARSRQVGGTGLGLAIVKHVIRRHQGHLAVESRPGQGSTFSILLPIPSPIRNPDAS
jgi:two-component system phosphate regulon sensor histidine kinase PhoR